MKNRPLEQVRSAMRTAPEDAYWCRRFCEIAIFSLDRTSSPEQEALIQELVPAIARVATKDPDLFISTSRIEVGRFFGVYNFPFEVMEQLEGLIRIEPPSREHHVKGVLWVASAAYRHTRGETGFPFYERAAKHLKQVSESDRSEEFYESFCEALAEGPFKELPDHVDSILAGVRGFGRAQVILAIAGAAARNRDWVLFDRCRPLYDEVREHQDHAHGDCAMFNFDGLRLLAREDLAGLAPLMKALLDRAQNVPFLGTPDTVVLIPELISRKLLLDECSAYLALADRGGRSKVLAELRSRLLAAKRN